MVVVDPETGEKTPYDSTQQTGYVPLPEEEEEGAAAIDDRAALIAEFDELGAAYDKRWSTEKLANELIKAKKIRGA